MYATSNHPIIPPPSPAVKGPATDSNVDNYFASISSVDRNIVKYPNSNTFSVDLPQEYTNIHGVSLHHSFFPNVSIDFTLDQNNVDLVFRLKSMHLPNSTTSNTVAEIMMYIFTMQDIATNNYHRIRIADGNYTHSQLLLEVQNRMNQVVTEAITEFYSDDPSTYRWGDYTYVATHVLTTEGHSVMVNPRYSSYADAAEAHNAIFGTNIPIPEDNSPIQPIELSRQTNVNTSALNSPPILVIPTVEWITDLHMGDGTYKSLHNDPTQTNNTDTFIQKYVTELILHSGGYEYFKLFYDEIQNKIVFENNVSDFAVICDFVHYYSMDALDAAGVRHRSSNREGCDRECVFSASGRPDHVNWGLPVYMGFSGKEYTVPYTVTGPLPTFYYYDKNTHPLSYNPFHHATTPGLADATIHVLTPCGQLNLSSEVYYYLEIDGLNIVDELLPFNNDAYAVTTGTSTGIIKSIFSKRAILSNIDMQYRSGLGEHKIFAPPLRRMKRINVKIRYHDGRLPDFGSVPFDFTLMFVCQNNQLRVPNRFVSPA